MNKKILVFFILIIMALTVNVKTIYATTLGTVMQGGQNFIQAGENETEKIKQDDIEKLSKTVYNILLVLGIAVAVIIGAILGIKFMTEGIEGQAEVKKALIPYIIGCVIIFGAFGIWKLVVDVIQAV